MTELEFEELLNFSMKDESAVPDSVSEKLNKKLNAKLRYKRMIKTMPASAAACLIVGVVLTSVIYNNSDDYNNHISKTDKVQNHGVVIATVDKTDNLDELKQPDVNKTISEPIGEKNEKTKSVSVDNKPVKKASRQNESSKVSDIKDIKASNIVPVEEDFSAEEVKEAGIETHEPMSYARAVSESNELTLAQYLENNQESIEDVSAKIKAKMIADEYIEYFEDFSGITGEEKYYLTESNELVIIFMPGTVAAEENGEIYINVGVIIKTNEESGE